MQDENIAASSLTTSDYPACQPATTKPPTINPAQESCRPVACHVPTTGQSITMRNSSFVPNCPYQAPNSPTVTQQYYDSHSRRGTDVRQARKTALLEKALLEHNLEGHAENARAANKIENIPAGHWWPPSQLKMPDVKPRAAQELASLLTLAHNELDRPSSKTLWAISSTSPQQLRAQCPRAPVDMFAAVPLTATSCPEPKNSLNIKGKRLVCVQKRSAMDGARRTGVRILALPLALLSPHPRLALFLHLPLSLWRTFSRRSRLCHMRMPLGAVLG
ncbi:hypothetical protein MAPG_10259 [Magnaporthiopsis poae ATCC 64411]|uniref:Uncharacterized protein n=1 Tax=Magnaporthiopsis poae (strain ATCC 64411 / 73-15) TaxID=644358 RepID=A0A0C4EC45_MAGP6|nr:hypothetical protein MAPG_10259 [Magnaporthiopsis poae ATCC 64411]